MNRLVKICVFSALVVAGSLFSAPKSADAGYGYGYGYGYRSHYHSYYAPRYVAPVYVAPVYNYGYSYGGFCY